MPHTSSTCILPTYNQLPVAFDHGKGATLYDADGNEYLDALCGIGVTSLGHVHPDLTETLTEQAAKLWHTSNLYHIPNQQQLAEKLCRLSGMEAAFICNSGTEANEAAIKIARLYGNQIGIAHPTILVFENSFHGRSMGALSATANPKIRQGFDPLLPGFTWANINDWSSVSEAVQQNSNIVAVLVEPIQGEGGLTACTPEFLQSLQQLCEEKKWLLMLDEIQCGMGRSGQWFAYQHSQIKPQVMTLAKALGNGVPIGCCLTSGLATPVFTAGKHGTTFGGNPLSTAVASKVIDTINDQQLLKRVNQLSDLFQQQINQQLEPLGIVKELRINGLMIGIVLDENKVEISKIVTTALENKLLINVTAGNVIRMLPPFILTDEQTVTIVERLKQTLSTLIF